MREALGKGPIEFHFDLLKKVIDNRAGDQNDYDAERYMAAPELVIG